MAAHAVMAAVLIYAAAEAADAQRGGLPPRAPVIERPIQRVFFIEQVVVEEEAARPIAEEPRPAVPPPPPPPPAPPRKPYALGKSYASLPGGCMKLIDAGVSYYKCGAEWYRQDGSQYKAVAQP